MTLCAWTSRPLNWIKRSENWGLSKWLPSSVIILSASKGAITPDVCHLPLSGWTFHRLGCGVGCGDSWQKCQGKSEVKVTMISRYLKIMRYTSAPRLYSARDNDDALSLLSCFDQMFSHPVVLDHSTNLVNIVVITKAVITEVQHSVSCGRLSLINTHHYCQWLFDSLEPVWSPSHLVHLYQKYQKDCLS